MSKAGKKASMHEIAETRAVGKDMAFDQLIERVKAGGGEITRDETTPLYVEIGMQEFEVGSQRIVEFSLNRYDFQLTRKVETHILQGDGRQKHTESLGAPRSHIKMKKKESISNDWEAVDFEDMF